MNTEIITLPSGISCGIQELTAEAEKLLTDKAEIKSGQWINKFMAKAVVSIDGKEKKNQQEVINFLLDLKTGDRNFLLLMIRIQNYGEEMIFNYECPKCHKTCGYQVNLQELLDSGVLKNSPYRDDMPIEIQTSRGVAEIDYMTGRNEQWLASIKDLDTIHLAMAACKKLDGKAPEYAEFLKLSLKDISKIRMSYAQLSGGLDARLKLDCDKCDSEYEVMLYQVPDFFTPMTSPENIGL